MALEMLEKAFAVMPKDSEAGADNVCLDRLDAMIKHMKQWLVRTNQRKAPIHKRLEIDTYIARVQQACVNTARADHDEAAAIDGSWPFEQVADACGYAYGATILQMSADTVQRALDD